MQSDSEEPDYSQPWEFGDLVLLVEGKKVYVNKASLVMASKVFRAMLTGNFLESKMEEVPLPEKKYEDFLQFMAVLHLPPKPVTPTNVYKILPLAHEYQIQHIVNECHRVLTDMPPSIKHLNLADRFRLDKLRAKALHYAKKTDFRWTLKREDGFNDIEKDTLIEVLTFKVDHLENYGKYKIKD